MIPQITEINFPSYATLHQATASLSDMGDKVINAQIKIDGDIKPDFIGRIGTDAHGDDWEIEFLGERYIQPLRKPQAKKDNTTLNSLIDLTFYHWAIYQLKRYFFVALANVESGTPIVDKYIAPLAVNLPDFAKALDDMLLYYFPADEETGRRAIYVYKNANSYINPEFTGYDHGTKYIEVDHTYIWEVLQKTYELFECRWSMVKDANGDYAIKFGYPVNVEHQHIFQYGREGGLVSVERQVQDADIRNQLLGRGGEKNLPYMYFKDYEKFHPNSTDSAYQNYGIPDPDAIPELENILFSELRDKNFRSYVQGWKVNSHRQLSTDDGWSASFDATETQVVESDGTTYQRDDARMSNDWAYAKGATDEKFDPTEYVKDDASIAEYGLLQGGLENNEDIFPTIQDMTIQAPCEYGSSSAHQYSAGHLVETRADEVVAVEEVVTDMIETGEQEGDRIYNEEQKSPTKSTNAPFTQTRQSNTASSNKWLKVAVKDLSDIAVDGDPFVVPEGYYGNFLYRPEVKCKAKFNIKFYAYGPDIAQWGTSGTQSIPYSTTVKKWAVYNADTGQQMPSTTDLPAGKYFLRVWFNAKGATKQFNEESMPAAGPYRGFTNHPYEVNGKITAYYDFTARCDLYNFPGEVLANTDANSMPLSDTITIAKEASDTLEIWGDYFSVPEEGAMMVEGAVDISPTGKSVREVTVKVLDVDASEFVPTYNIPEGNYRLQYAIKITNISDAQQTFTVSLKPAFVHYLNEVEEWKPTFDIWIKNIFGSNRADYQNDEQYTNSVWEPLRAVGEEMTVAFQTGNLSAHSDWEFKIHKIAYDNSKTVEIEDGDGVKHLVRSEWRLTLIKTDAEGDAIHKYVPYKDFNAVPLDRFILTSIYLPWAYVYSAEQRLNTYKEDELGTTKDVQPTWVASIDRGRFAELNMLWDIAPGDKVWVKDPRFTDPTGIQLYVVSATYTWQGDGANLPDVEYIFSDKVETSLSTVERVQGEIRQLSAQVKSLSNVEQTVRKVGDAVYLRKDGFEDTTYSPTHVAKELTSEDFREGLIGGQGWAVQMDPDGNSVLEVDQLKVRQELHVNQLAINQIAAIGGKEILSAASMVVTRVDTFAGGYKCYFDQQDGTVANLFHVDDVAMSQVFDESNQEQRFYKRKVLEVGANYIVLSYSVASGDGEPAVGDTIVQYGNYTDSTRQYVVIRDVIGGGYEQMLSGVNSVTATGNEYYFAGARRGANERVLLNDVDGAELYDSNGARLGYLRPSVAPRWFVGNANGEYAQWVNGELTVKGRIYVLNPSGGYSNLTSYINTIDYLQAAMPEDTDQITTISGGIVLSKIIGVVNQNNLVAGLNASTLGQDSTNGKLMIFAGAAGAASVNTAKFRVYENGLAYASYMHLDSGCRIGDFEIRTPEGEEQRLQSYKYDDTTGEFSSVFLYGDRLETRYSKTSAEHFICQTLWGSGLGSYDDGDLYGATIYVYRGTAESGIQQTRNIGLKCTLGGLPSTGAPVVNTGLMVEMSGPTTSAYSALTQRGISLDITGRTCYGVRMSLAGGASTYGIYIDANGPVSSSYAVYAYRGKYAGLRLVSSLQNDASFTYSPAATTGVNFIMVTANNGKITLPSSPQDGQVYLIGVSYRTSSTYYACEIDAGDHYIVCSERATAKKISHTQFHGLDVLIYDASASVNNVDGAWFAYILS